MTFSDIIAKWKEFVAKLNSAGVPIPMVRDPKTKMGSVSLTMVVVSFSAMIIPILMAMALAINKWGGFFDSDSSALNDIKEAFWMAFDAAGLSTSLYFGRKFQRDSSGAVNLDTKDNSKE